MPSFASVARRLSTIHKKCFSSLNSYPISIMFGLFERACACALNYLMDIRNLNYSLTYALINTLLGQSVHILQEILLPNSHSISILFRLFEKACACALHSLTDFRNFNYSLTYDHEKCFSSLNSYPISILFGLFQRARACALNLLADFINFNY